MSFWTSALTSRRAARKDGSSEFLHCFHVQTRNKTRLKPLCPFSRKENAIFRLRKWLVSRLSSIIDNYQVKRQEDLIMDVAR